MDRTEGEALDKGVSGQSVVWVRFILSSKMKRDSAMDANPCEGPVFQLGTFNLQPPARYARGLTPWPAGMCATERRPPSTA